jgi:PTS system ascorbate-specific IIA component
MIGVLLLGQREIGEALVVAAEHVLGARALQLEVLPLEHDREPEHLRRLIEQRLAHLDDGHGVLILADIYGASHTNVACQLLRKNRVELVSGVNLPMLLRVLNYRQLPLAEVVRKAVSGGGEGIVRAAQPPRSAEDG